MKKYILLLLICPLLAMAQVGINTDNPQATLDVNGTAHFDNLDTSTKVPTRLVFLDDINSEVKSFRLADNQFVLREGKLYFTDNITEISSNHTITENDDTLIVNASSNININLPSVSNNMRGKEVTIKNIGTGNVNFKGARRVLGEFILFNSLAPGESVRFIATHNYGGFWIALYYGNNVKP